MLYRNHSIVAPFCAQLLVVRVVLVIWLLIENRQCVARVVLAISLLIENRQYDPSAHDHTHSIFIIILPHAFRRRSASTRLRWRRAQWFRWVSTWSRSESVTCWKARTFPSTSSDSV